ncbi:MAG: hypothetical protein IJ054_07740 [Lachnospiraceae bacterium]|nr:hypothetical protein [Lachnospiraceae bacterium]
MDENEATSISELIKKIAGGTISTNNIYEGNVISSNPLKITLVNDTKISLSSVNLAVPKRIRNEGLNSGEKVFLMSYNNGKKFYILDKA